MEQGLTSQMLSVISDLIREKVGIGVKKAEPLTEDELKEEHTAQFREPTQVYST